MTRNPTTADRLAQLRARLAAPAAEIASDLSE